MYLYIINTHNQISVKRHTNCHILMYHNHVQVSCNKNKRKFAIASILQPQSMATVLIFEIILL